jgi:hypothetical protein
MRVCEPIRKRSVKVNLRSQSIEVRVLAIPPKKHGPLAQFGRVGVF